MGPVKQKGNNPHQLLPDSTGQLNFLQENVCADFFENFEAFASCYAVNLLKFAKKFAHPFSFKKINCLIKFGSSWCGLVLFCLTRFKSPYIFMKISCSRTPQSTEIPIFYKIWTVPDRLYCISTLQCLIWDIFHALVSASKNISLYLWIYAVIWRKSLDIFDLELLFAHVYRRKLPGETFTCCNASEPLQSSFHPIMCSALFGEAPIMK